MAPTVITLCAISRFTSEPAPFENLEIAAITRSGPTNPKTSYHCHVSINQYARVCATRKYSSLCGGESEYTPMAAANASRVRIHSEVTRHIRFGSDHARKRIMHANE